MKQYLELLDDILTNGTYKPDRTGVGTYSVFGRQTRFNLSKSSFPLLTTKKIHIKSIIVELLWFLKGDTNIKYLNDHGVKIWNEWADADGDLGPIYSKQWIAWKDSEGNEINQISNIINTIKNDPNSRRIILNSWNVGDIPKMKLAPCHCLAQFYVVNGTLSCQLYQRSCDFFIGCPYNIASYSLLTIMIAQVCNLKVGEFIHTFGDVHLYSNHIQQAKLQLTRKPKKLPQIIINPDIKNIFDFKLSDFTLLNYKPHPHIKADIAV